MEKRQWDEHPPAVVRDEDLISTTLRSKGFGSSRGYDNTERFMKDNVLRSNDENKREKPHKHAIRENTGFIRSDAKTGKPETLGISGGKHIPDFPWKWDLPDIQRSPVERRKRRKETTKTNTDGNYVNRENDEKVKELNAQISWIFEESSESETELSKTNTRQDNHDEQNVKKGTFDEKFRDHLMKELLKQGKDMKWFVAGTKKALDNLEKGQHATVPGIQSAVRVSHELNQFLTKSMRPYYQEKKRGKRTKKKQPYN